jgi:hypothetical protein
VDLITLADIPELAGDDPAPKTQITIARLDKNLRDPRYGRFAISQDDVDGWTKNLAGVFGGKVAIDADHSSDRGQGTRAAAWITGLSQKGKLVNADVEFTPWGAELVRSKEYQFTSPTFVGNYVDEHGVSHGKALLGAALTNRPVLRKDMPTLSLSRERFEGVAVPAAGKKQRRAASRARAHARGQVMELSRDSSDSRRRMLPTLPELAKLLDLAEDADNATVLAAVAQLAAGSGRDSDDSQLTQPVVGEKSGKGKSKKSKKGKRMMAMSAKETAALITAANAGQAASVQLAEQTFDVAWAKTLSEGRAAPAQEDTLRALFRENSELAIKTLDGMQRIVPVKPTGSGEAPADAGQAPTGIDPERYQLDHEARQRAVTLAAERKISVDEAYLLAAIELDEAHAEQARGF